MLVFNVFVQVMEYLFSEVSQEHQRPTIFPIQGSGYLNHRYLPYSFYSILSFGCFSMQLLGGELLVMENE
jgi:hypothetical protein